MTLFTTLRVNGISGREIDFKFAGAKGADGFPGDKVATGSFTRIFTSIILINVHLFGKLRNNVILETSIGFFITLSSPGKEIAKLMQRTRLEGQIT